MSEIQAETTPPKNGTRSAIANGETATRLPYARTIELRGHIIDSHIPSQVMDLVMDRRGVAPGGGVHADFVLADAKVPATLLAIELDDRGHGRADAQGSSSTSPSPRYSFQFCL